MILASMKKEPIYPDRGSFNTLNDLYMWRIIFMYVKMKKAILEEGWVQYDTSG